MAASFIVSGATKYRINGVYTKTKHVCNGKPVYSKNGSVLFIPNGVKHWMIDYHTQFSCKNAGYISNEHNCAESPDNAFCAGNFIEKVTALVRTTGVST